MEFEFDQNKSASNLEKHGIGFIEAQQLWDNETVELPLQTLSESRFIVVGTIKQKFWSAIITYRGDSIRIISVRRSRNKEIQDYESEEN